MSAGTWLNKDGLYLKFGTTKATPNIGGEYLSYGPNRFIEFSLDLTLNTNAARIISDTLFFPAGANTYIEQIELVAETAAATGTAFNLGLIQADRTTVPAGYGTSLVNGIVTASLTPAGTKVTLVEGTTYYGSLIGSHAAGATQPYYVTSYNTDATAFTTGLIRVRILYHGTGTIDDSLASTNY